MGPILPRLALNSWAQVILLPRPPEWLGHRLSPLHSAALTFNCLQALLWALHDNNKAFEVAHFYNKMSDWASLLLKSEANRQLSIAITETCIQLFNSNNGAQARSSDWLMGPSNAPQCCGTPLNPGMFSFATRNTKNNFTHKMDDRVIYLKTNTWWCFPQNKLLAEYRPQFIDSLSESVTWVYNNASFNQNMHYKQTSEIIVTYLYFSVFQQLKRKSITG